MGDELKKLISDFYGSISPDVYKWHKPVAKENELTPQRYQNAIEKYQKLTKVDLTKLDEGTSAVVKKTINSENKEEKKLTLGIEENINI